MERKLKQLINVELYETRENIFFEETPAVKSHIQSSTSYKF